MTIPPASVRSVRPCCDYTKDTRCIFYESNEFGVFCKLKLGKHSEDDLDEMIRPFFCDRNFTTDEIQALIDQHNQQEQQP